MTAFEAGVRLGGAMFLASAGGAMVIAPAIMDASLAPGIAILVSALLLAAVAAHDAGQAVEAIVAAIRAPRDGGRP